MLFSSRQLLDSLASSNSGLNSTFECIFNSDSAVSGCPVSTNLNTEPEYIRARLSTSCCCVYVVGRLQYSLPRHQLVGQQDTEEGLSMYTVHTVWLSRSK